MFKRLIFILFLLVGGATYAVQTTAPVIPTASGHGSIDNTNAELPCWETMGLEDILIAPNATSSVLPPVFPKLQHEEAFQERIFNDTLHVVLLQRSFPVAIPVRACDYYIYFLDRINR